MAGNVLHGEAPGKHQFVILNWLDLSIRWWFLSYNVLLGQTAVTECGDAGIYKTDADAGVL